MSTQLLTTLRSRFDPDEVKQRAGRGGIKLDYISIDATINRLLDTLGLSWSFRVDEWKLDPTNDGKYLAVVSGTLQFTTPGTVDHRNSEWSEHSGIGAAIANDPDDAVKTALAEALKKACHQVGIGLYLWDEDERSELELLRQARSGDLSALKRAVVRIAKRQGLADTSRSNLATHFNVQPNDLDTVEVLSQIMEDHYV